MIVLAYSVVLMRGMNSQREMFASVQASRGKLNPSSGITDWPDLPGYGFHFLPQSRLLLGLGTVMLRRPMLQGLPTYILHMLFMASDADQYFIMDGYSLLMDEDAPEGNPTDLQIAISKDPSLSVSRHVKVQAQVCT